MPLRLPLLALAFAFAFSAAAAAQDATPEQGGAEPAPQPAQCFPACRAGYVCHQGACVSVCNPPCPPNQSCVDGTRCEPAAPAGAYEPPPPPRKTFAEKSHAALGLHLGLGGTGELGGVENDLVTTIGLNIRGDIPIIDYLVIGPLFQFGAWRPDVSGPAPGRGYYVDIDLYLRGRYPIELDSIALQFWAGVPIGLSMSILGDDLAAAGTANELSRFAVGWNVGVLAGGAVHFTKKFGMFAEVGWLQHKMSHNRELGGDAALRLSQTNLNLGFVFAN